MSITSIRRVGAEADDLLYHIAKMSIDPVTIITSDKDLIQTVDDNVSVYNPNHDKVYTPKEVLNTFGVSVEQYVDWRAIQGDSGDNIAGVPGIGEKTATKLFQQYKTLTGITNAAMGRNPEQAMTGKLAESIKEFGFDRIAKNIYITALYADRVGARLSIRYAERNWTRLHPDYTKKYLLSNGFMSLLGSPIQGFQRKAQPPNLTEDAIRTPLVDCRRIAV
jgi:5'-3' exonuclease